MGEILLRLTLSVLPYFAWEKVVIVRDIISLLVLAFLVFKSAAGTAPPPVFMASKSMEPRRISSKLESISLAVPRPLSNWSG
jgi:hypothetical protein